jgi:Metallo-beta-lactamase superfamily
MTSAQPVGNHLSPPREIAKGIWWFPACLAVPVGGRLVHTHNALYLVVGSDKTLLFDSGSASAWPDIAPALEHLLDGRPLDYLVPSHSELPHSGNVRALLAKYPLTRVIGDVRDLHLYFPAFGERFERLPRGSRIDLGGHVFELVDAVIRDLPATQWGYEETQQVLFTSDGFAYSHRPPLDSDDRPVHLPGECASLASELDVPPGPDQIVWITRAALHWARFKKMTTYLPRYEELLRAHPTKLIAPAHGAVIDDPSLIPIIWRALDLAYAPADSVWPRSSQAN